MKCPKCNVEMKMKEIDTGMLKVKMMRCPKCGKTLPVKEEKNGD